MVGMPVFNGQDFVAETLNSIKNQTFLNYEVLISIDGNGQRSLEACKPFTSDSRFRIITQIERLGWAGNLNWLMAQCEADFFCYWQQDDLTDPNYLEALHANSQNNLAAVCSYSDLEWFGARQEKEECESIRGAPVERAIAAMNGAVWVPFRGLIRRAALQKIGPLRTGHEMSSLEDLVWMVKLAREGELQRVEGTRYYKRAHDKAVHLNWHSWPQTEQRAAWIQHGLGLLEAILPVAPSRDQMRILETVLDRLISSKYWRLYESADQDFAADMLEAASTSEAVSPLLSDLRDLLGQSSLSPALHDFPYCESGLRLIHERREVAGIDASEDTRGTRRSSKVRFTTLSAWAAQFIAALRRKKK